MSTFVTIGNAKQTFERFFELVESVAMLLPGPVYVQSGHTHYESSEFVVEAFLDMSRFEQLMSEAEVLITHAGAGSIINAIQKGKKPIVIPRLRQFGEHVDNHQLEFAEHLAQKGSVYLVQNSTQMRAAVVDICNPGPEACKNPENSSVGQLIRDRLRFYAQKTATNTN